MNYRNLADDEIHRLEEQGCRSDNWSLVQVKDGFIPDRICHSEFSGNITLGIFSGRVSLGNGIEKDSGLFNSSLQDCTVGDGCYITDVGNLVRYDISDNVAISNVHLIVLEGESYFGNGIRIEVLNEGGGREKPLFDALTAQVAYLIVTYRHDQKLIDKLYAIVDQYVKQKKSSRGTIGEGARIQAVTTIKNVYIGPCSVIEGAELLREGTIASNRHHPVCIGEGVIAREFIILSGATVDGASLVDKCIIGQGVKIGKQFSAENSGFFANSEGFHGEALSIFAGPYTVTHHKSTLLIAGLFSFYNAGSGSNQSNHMYKLGPNHQGILERGAKTGSFSYMMWPCRVGAFTGVIGKHYTNFDTADMPFSYILESGGLTLLMPAMNLCTVGTVRDNAKWPNRDRRKDPDKRDLLNFALFSPYTVGKIVRGMEQLRQLELSTATEKKLVEYNGAFIKRSKLQFGYETYELAVCIYIGNEVIRQVEKNSGTASFNDLVSRLFIREPDALGRWVDMAGMLAPQNSIDELKSEIYGDAVNSVEQLTARLKEIHEEYEKYSWVWCIDLLQNRLGILFGDITREQMVQVISDWLESSMEFNRRVLFDAEKEFSEKSRIGYGIDGGQDERNRDFEAVLGKFEENKFVKGLMEETEAIRKKAEKTISFIQSLG